MPVMTTYQAKGPSRTVELGDLLGHPMEPALLHARVVGLLHREPGRDVIYRLFTQADLDAGRTYPTGEYRATWLCVAYEGPADPAQWRLTYSRRPGDPF